MKRGRKRRRKNPWYGSAPRHAAAARKGWKVRKRKYGKAGVKRRRSAGSRKRHSARGFRTAGGLFAAA